MRLATRLLTAPIAFRPIFLLFAYLGLSCEVILVSAFVCGSFFLQCESRAVIFSLKKLGWMSSRALLKCFAWCQLLLFVRFLFALLWSCKIKSVWHFAHCGFCGTMWKCSRHFSDDAAETCTFARMIHLHRQASLNAVCFFIIRC